jgi:hypothetical protein
MKAPVRDRVELDKRLRDAGVDGKLFKNDENRDKAAWYLKQVRLGSYRKKINPREMS